MSEKDREVALHFRDQLREAREIALKDTEAFEAVVFVFERIGIYLTGRIDGLGKYGESIAAYAKRSPLAETIPAQLPGWHTTFKTLYDLVRHARNDALHEGESHSQSNERLAKQLGKVVEDGDLKLVDGSTCKPEEPISRVLELSGGPPVLVIGSNDDLRGIITPFDIL